MVIVTKWLALGVRPSCWLIQRRQILVMLGPLVMGPTIFIVAL